MSIAVRFSSLLTCIERREEIRRGEGRGMDGGGGRRDQTAGARRRSVLARSSGRSRSLPKTSNRGGLRVRCDEG